MKHWILALALLPMFACAAKQATVTPTAPPTVVMETSYGSLTIALDSN